MTAPPVSPPILYEAAAPPDAAFEDLFRAALELIGNPEAPWTDHNIHDPGITLLDAALWALADLHYRTEAHTFDAWSSLDAGAATSLPLPTGEVARAVVSHVLSEHEAAARDAIAGARNRAEAIAALERAFATDAETAELRSALLGVIEPGSDAGLLAALPAPLFRREAAEGVLRLLRQPAVLAVALDRSHEVERAVREDDTAGTTEALHAAMSGSGLWDEEVEDLREQAHARLLVERLRGLKAEILEITGATDSVAEAVGALGTLLGLGPHEADLALRADRCAPAPPEWWETHTGRSVDWPPHPVQARPVEPVFDADYRRLVLGVDGVRRAWIVPGLARGLRWDGEVNRDSLPYRQGALTLLVEPDEDLADLMLPRPDAPLGARNGRRLRFLERCLREALGVEGEQAEVDAPFEDYGHHIGPLSPRRLLGDELCAAVLSTCPVVVGGTIHVAPGVQGRRVVQRAEALLARFLSPSREASFERHDPPPPPTCEERLDGPWPWRPEPPPGWTPGDPVRVTEVLQVLLDVPGVVSVSSLRLQSGEAPDNDAPWQTRSLDIDPFCAPRYAAHCFVLAVAPGGADA